MPISIEFETLGVRLADILAVISRALLMFILPLIPRSAWSQESLDAQTEPLDTFRPYVRADYGYDSNLFRLENDTQAQALLGTTDKSETYHTLAAGMDVDWRISRQVVKAHVEVNQTRFDTYKRLDYKARAGLLQWNWLVGKFAAGDLGVSEIKTQASFTDLQSPTQNLLTTRQAYAHGGIKLALPWQLNLGFVRTKAGNSSANQQALNYDENKYSGGIQYETQKGTLLEFKSQYREGKYPNRQIVGTAPVDNGYRQYDNGLAAAWSPSFKTKLKGELNYTQRRYADVAQRDFSGVTGRLTSDWSITDKTTLGLLVYRDIGVVENNTASYSINHGVTASADWRPTVKFSFIARAIYERQTYAGDPGFVLSSAPTRQDEVSTFQLNAGYKVLRKTKLNLLLQHGVRHSNQALAGYQFNSALINLRSEF
jgi:exopolysaccharide biosynthesis operon protein EpsL